MFFLPFTLIIFILFIFLLPVLFLLGYFHIIVVGFESLGISPQATLLILYSILIGSLINIPLTKKKLVLVEESRFFGLLNSFYFLLTISFQGFALKPVLTAIVLMTIVSKIFSRIIPGKGIVVSAFIPPLFSALFALVLAPQYAAACAFISGILGTLIGADLLNLGKIRNYRGYISIGGAGVFDGILLVGVVSALLSGF